LPGTRSCAAGAGRIRQFLALRVGASDPAEVAAVTRPRAGDEKAHAGVLRLGGPWDQSEDDQSETGQTAE
jgi:hypothetical protein